ncbi:hypothetical protein GW17_00031505 [Ensete ventricosum]|nr:hypothetical protein GW17_00031505 [Ensete ventricosum]
MDGKQLSRTWHISNHRKFYAYHNFMIKIKEEISLIETFVYKAGWLQNIVGLVQLRHQKWSSGRATKCCRHIKWENEDLQVITRVEPSRQKAV